MFLANSAMDERFASGPRPHLHSRGGLLAGWIETFRAEDSRVFTSGATIDILVKNAIVGTRGVPTNHRAFLPLLNLRLGRIDPLY